MGNQKPVIYVGVTNNLIRRVGEHKLGAIAGFSKNYKTYKLLYFEETSSVEEAIKREKQLKNWHRDWKLNLICNSNPDLIDLSLDWDYFQSGPETSSG